MLSRLPFLGAFLGRLRFPQLFILFGLLFAVDLVVPEPVPFIDEILLAVGTLLMGSIKKRRVEEPKTLDESRPDVV